MKPYQHTQRATVVLIAMGISTIVALAIGLAISRVAFLIAPLFVIVAWLFSSLTIELTEDRLRWHFGPGLIRKEVPLADIQSAQPVKTNVLEGWGIHLSRYGWLYNVSGFDAVALHLNSSKRFALGTDEPNAFLAALAERRRACQQ
jgi:hypothetical protein